jgi:hypothetical protein
MKILLLIIIAYGFCFTIWAQDKRTDISVNENGVRISWTKDYDNILYFEVERKSSLSGTWRSVGKQTAGERKFFSFNDNNLRGQKYYFRVKAVLEEGEIIYSDILEADLNKPFGFRLNQNYPNPFNPETRINYSIPEGGFIDLKIYNLLGQEIHTLVSEYKDAGEHTVHFRADELNSGLYIYKLISGDNVITRKMTYIK